MTNFTNVDQEKCIDDIQLISFPLNKVDSICLCISIVVDIEIKKGVKLRN